MRSCDEIMVDSSNINKSEGDLINPLSKDKSRATDPASSRGISLISISVLNCRILKWLGSKKILAEQNGFGSDGNCIDHLYTIYDIIDNRKSPKFTYVLSNLKRLLTEWIVTVFGYQ